MRILIADDDALFQTLLRRQLSMWNYEVEVASDGASALARLQKADGPSLAILDWNMPGMDGLEVCRRLRDGSPERYIYLILATANDTPADLLAGLESGADDYLTKPLQMTELRLRLRAGIRIVEFEELQKRQAAELARSNAELEQFAYIASHDLQEPLRMITGFIQLLAGRYAGRLDEKADKYIGFVVDGAKRMQQLIGGLLQLSRVGTTGGEFETVNLESVLTVARTDLGAAIQESGAIISHGELPCVTADPVQVAQILRNLIGNAMKFCTARPPRIHVSSVETSKECIVSVKDNGIGIKPQDSERIFQIFQRIHSREEYPGTGIGLAVCRKIAQRHGGRIWLDSSPGSGSTFHFSISKTTVASGSPQLEAGTRLASSLSR